MNKLKIFVLSGSHWDREWYQPFEAFRFRLVRMMDELLDILENVPAYRCFFLDGQTVMLEDYLAIRPENREKTEKFIREKKLLIGPWYTMPDEFLISGEALVRNLQKGGDVCARYGVRAAGNGYVCDIFGHNSQMPQIFRGFGIASAALFRGRSGYEKDNFLWEGADGSRLTVHKLHPDYAYSDFYFVVRWPFEDRPFDYDEMAERLTEYIEKERSNFSCNAHLMIDGIDHIDPERELPVILRELSKRLPEVEFIHSDFEDYSREIEKNAASLRVEKGALYDVGKEGVNNLLLKNVLSSLVQLKQANDFCEAHLTLVTEPLKLFAENFLPPMRTAHQGFLDRAWELLLKNQPHDSICGCSVTATHLDCENRFKRIKEIIASVDDDILGHFAANIPGAGKGKDGAFAVFNMNQRAQNGVAAVKARFPRGGHQFSFRFYGPDGNEIPYNILSCKKVLEKQAAFKKLIRFPEFDEIEFVMDINVPAFGYSVITYDLLKQERTAPYQWTYSRFDPPNRYIGSMRTAANAADNGLLRVEINPNGALTVTDKETGKTYESLLSYEDTSDVGEGWNYVKSRFDSEYGTLCGLAQMAVEADFPNFVRFRIENDLILPVTASYEEGRAAEKRTLHIVTHVTLRKNDKRIDITTEVENNCENHRLRAVFPTGFRAKTFKTLLPFDMYTWDIAKKDNSRDKEIDTFVNPNQGVVTLSDGKDSFTLLTRGLYETAVIEREDTPVFLTLFRSFPSESSEYRSEMGRMLRKMTFEYAMDFTRYTDNEAVMAANGFKNGLFARSLSGAGKAGMSASQAFSDIAGGAVVSALRNGRGAPEIRIYDTGNGCSGTVGFAAPCRTAELVDFKGEPAGKADIKQGRIVYTLKPKEIKTFRFTLETDYNGR